MGLFKRVKNNELPEDDDHHILVDELIYLTGSKAKQAGVHTDLLRRVAVYDADEDTTLEIITNNLDWKAATVAELYRRRWDIETFFKLLKQNLNVKTFVGPSENAVKAQIFVALIAYLLLELLRRVKANGHTAFSNFVEKIRICLCFYLTQDYVIMRIQLKMRSIRNRQLRMDGGSHQCKKKRNGLRFVLPGDQR